MGNIILTKFDNKFYESFETTNIHFELLLQYYCPNVIFNHFNFVLFFFTDSIKK